MARWLVLPAALALAGLLAGLAGAEDWLGSGHEPPDAIAPRAVPCEPHLPILVGRAGGRGQPAAPAVADSGAVESAADGPRLERAADAQEADECRGCAEELARRKAVEKMLEGARDPTKPAWTRAADAGGDLHADPVLHALRWLAAHQALDGHWSAATYGRSCEGQEDASVPPSTGTLVGHDVGATSLVLLAYLGAGYTNRGKHEFSRVVHRGLRWLVASVAEDGRLRDEAGRFAAWDHVVGTLALVEAYGMTESPLWRPSAARALAALLRLREADGSWRYGTGSDEGDAALTLWAALPLTSARLIAVDHEKRGKEPDPAWGDAAGTLARLQAAAEWLRHHEDGESHALPAWWHDARADRPGSDPGALTALAGCLRRCAAEAVGPVRTWEDQRQPRLPDPTATAVLRLLPEPGPEALPLDPFLAWTGGLLLFDEGREAWRTWDAHLDAAVVPAQVRTGDACALEGSWAPPGGAEREGDRLLATALSCLSLQIHYRYDCVAKWTLR